MLVRIVPTRSSIIAPLFIGSIGATTILTRGASSSGEETLEQLARRLH
jgi:hypothetical protein